MCIFCKIIDGEIPANVLYEDDKILVFNDIEPTAPTHILVIPKQHIESCDEITKENSQIIAYIFEQIPIIMKKLCIKDGYRIISNIGKNGNQTVKHLHFHILAGRVLSWPAG